MEGASPGGPAPPSQTSSPEASWAGLDLPVPAHPDPPAFTPRQDLGPRTALRLSLPPAPRPAVPGISLKDIVSWGRVLGRPRLTNPLLGPRGVRAVASEGHSPSRRRLRVSSTEGRRRVFSKNLPARCRKTSALVPGPGGAWAEVTGARGRPSLASRTRLVRSSPHGAVSYVWRAWAWAPVRVKSSNKRWEPRCPGTRGPRQSALISGNLFAVSGLT